MYFNRVLHARRLMYKACVQFIWISKSLPLKENTFKLKDNFDERLISMKLPTLGDHNFGNFVM